MDRWTIALCVRSRPIVTTNVGVVASEADGLLVHLRVDELLCRERQAAEAGYSPGTQLCSLSCAASLGVLVWVNLGGCKGGEDVETCLGRPAYVCLRGAHHGLRIAEVR